MSTAMPLPVSSRRLLDLAPATLRRYLQATEVWHGLAEDVRSRLGVDHMQRLSAVADTDARKRLAHDAVTMNLAAGNAN